MTDTELRPDATEALAATLRERIMVLDGAMGTTIQQQRPDEAGYRGERFADHPRSLRGDVDLLNLSLGSEDPALVGERVTAYEAALGRDGTRITANLDFEA